MNDDLKKWAAIAGITPQQAHAFLRAALNDRWQLWQHTWNTDTKFIEGVALHQEEFSKTHEWDSGKHAGSNEYTITISPMETKP